MNREEFIKAWHKRSDLGVGLLTYELDAWPCHCECIGCEGWQMIDEEQAKHELNLGHLTQKEFETRGK
jgi:hypothetical protein